MFTLSPFERRMNSITFGPSVFSYWAERVPASLLPFRNHAARFLTLTPEEEALIQEMYEEKWSKQLEAIYDEERSKQAKQERQERSEQVACDLPLPLEIGSLIQCFARPLLRYPREYKEAMAELGLQDWPELKAKLSTKDATEVIEYMRSYLAAYRLNLAAEHQYKYGGSNVNWANAYYNKLKAYAELSARL